MVCEVETYCDKCRQFVSWIDGEHDPLTCPNCGRLWNLPEHERSRAITLALENGAKLSIQRDRPDAVQIEVQDGYAIQALPHEEHYIVLEVKST